MRWLIEGVLPARGCVNVFGGADHAGKSTLLCEMVRAWRGKTTLFGLQTTPPEYISVLLADRPLEDNAFWAKAKQEDLVDHLLVTVEHKGYIQRVEEDKALVNGGAEHFGYLLSQMPRRANMVLLVDVFTSTFIGNPMNLREVKRNMDVINHICWRDNITLVGTGYAVKQTKDKRTHYERYIDRIIGASPLRGGASTVMYLSNTTESAADGYDCQVFEAVPRDAPAIQLGVKRSRDGMRFEQAALVKKQDPADLKPCFQILGYIVDKPLKVHEIYASYCEDDGDAPESTFRRWLSELVELKEIENPERGMYRRKQAS